MVVQLYVQRRLLRQAQLLAGLVPQAVAVGGHPWCLHAVHHDDGAGLHDVLQYAHDVLQVAAVAAYEGGVGWRGGSVDCNHIAVYRTEVAYVDADAGCAVAPHVLADDGLALRAHFEGLYLQVGEAEACLNADAARAGTYVPQHVAAGQVEGLQREQADGHLRDHLLAAVEQGEVSIGNAEGLVE